MSRPGAERRLPTLVIPSTQFVAMAGSSYVCPTSTFVGDVRLHNISVLQEVMKAVILDRVRVIATYEGVNIRAPQRLFALPSVVCLKEYKAIHGARPAFSRVSQRLFRTFDILPPSHIPSLTHPLSLNFRKKVQCFSPGRVSLPVLWLESNLEAVNIRPRRTPSPRWKVQLGKHCIGL
mmetsp:Transcript_8297/g.16860  ORF Transcript_8297/g.16860 Transcript_8297/m.16860 type:complete len:178 (-) Transcript_8297:3538-4071(-)